LYFTGSSTFNLSAVLAYLLRLCDCYELRWRGKQLMWAACHCSPASPDVSHPDWRRRCFDGRSDLPSEEREGLSFNEAHNLVCCGRKDRILRYNSLHNTLTCLRVQVLSSCLWASIPIGLFAQPHFPLSYNTKQYHHGKWSWARICDFQSSHCSLSIWA